MSGYKFHSALGFALAASADDANIQQLIVTASKRIGSLHKVPNQVTVFNQLMTSLGED
jgi:hypothetical protein